jgi:hypothetical protein
LSRANFGPSVLRVEAARVSKRLKIASATKSSMSENPLARVVTEMNERHSEFRRNKLFSSRGNPFPRIEISAACGKTETVHRKKNRFSTHQRKLVGKKN